MRNKLLLLVIAFFCLQKTNSQNVGIGIDEPLNKLHIAGSIIAHAPYLTTNTPPIQAQHFTLVNSTTLNPSAFDSVSRIFDPGGPGGNYNDNLLCYAFFQPVSNFAYEVEIETMNIGAGDSLIIKESASADAQVLLKVGNNYTTTGKYLFTTPYLYIIFKSNADGLTGAGFSLLVKKIFSLAGSVPDVSGIKRRAFFFDARNGSLRSGEISNDPVGNLSVALGYQPSATGIYSIALGTSTIASSGNSVAIGPTAKSTNSYAIAIGYNPTASGEESLALGRFVTASGFGSTALGRYVTASGNYSMAIGNFVSTNNVEGSLVIGDNSTATLMNAATSNSFRARFDGGYRFFTSSDLTTNAWLPSGSNAWSTSSDIRLKENFAEVDGEDFLKKIATLKLVSWNYKKQDATKFRHYGPMAQDFYAAFGKDIFGSIGNDTTINQADFDGVNMIAIQALEKRTAQQQREIEELKALLIKTNNELRRLRKRK